MNNGQVPDLGNPSLAQVILPQHYAPQNHTPNGTSMPHQAIPSQPPAFPNNFNMNNMQIPPGMDHETLRRQLLALRESQLQRRPSHSNGSGTMGTPNLNGSAGMGMNMGMSPQTGVAGQGGQGAAQGGQQGQGNFPQATPQQAAEKQRQLALMMQQLQHQRMQQAAYARSQQQQVLDSQQASAPDPNRGQTIPPQPYGNPSSQMHGQSQQFTQQQAQEQYLQQQLQHYQNQNSNSGQMRPVTPSTKPLPIGMAQQSPMSRDVPQSHIPGPSSAQNPLFQDRRPSLSVNPMMQETLKHQQQQLPTTRPFPETVPSIPPAASTSSYPSRPDDRPPPAKRARYKVEYHPLVRDITTAGGWDLHALNQGREAQLRCYQNLEVEDFGKIDIEGLCMSLRCGLSNEVSYALTALAMLSMPGKGQDKGGLGLAHCGELLSDLVDLVDLNAFGERGWQGWSLSVDAPRGQRSQGSERTNDLLTPVSSRSDSARMAHHAQELAWTLESTSTGYNLALASQSASTLREAAEAEARSYSFLFDPVVTRNIERSKKRVDTALVAINLLRNFSMMSDNFVPMTEYHDLMECLMRTCDLRLAKRPEHDTDNDDPAVFTLMDLLRIRHDVLDTVLNLAHDLDLSKLSTYAQRAIFDLLNSYISDVPCVNTSHRLTDDLFGQTGRLVPARTEWAIEALTRITTKDCNRQCLRQLPAKSIVSSFHTLVRYLPLSTKDGFSIDLVYTAASELLLRVVFCLYSLAWLSPLAVRTEIRDTTDAIPVLTLAVRRLMRLKPHPTSTIIVRRLMAVLGALNGASDELVDDGPAITFGANASVRGLNGWNDTKHCVQPGLLAGQEDLLTDMVMLASAQGVQLDAMTVDELEKAIWAKNSP